MNREEFCKKIEEIIGYTFCDKNLIVTAFLTPSKANEVPNTQSYNRLEFLGDNIIDTCVSLFLYQNTNLPEGKMTDIQQEHVNNEYLAKKSKELGLDKFVLYSRNQPKVEKIAADVFEALIGAIFVDSQAEHGLSVVYNWVIKNFELDKYRITSC